MEVEIEAQSSNQVPESKGKPTEKDISNEELQIYDRQRFIGVEVQKRLLNARVLLTPANGINTELAKNLILCGTNLSIADNEVITQDDVETNFLISPKDLGKIRGEVVKARLNDMNPMVKIDLYPTFDAKSFYEQLQNPEAQANSTFDNNFLFAFNIIASSTKSFVEMDYFDKLSHKLNIPYYNQLCCGLYGFFYVSLGSSFECTLQKPVVEVMNFTSKNKKKEPFKYEYFHKAVICSDVLSGIDGSNPRGAKPVYFAIQMMKKAEELGLVYDPYQKSDANDQVLAKILEQVDQGKLVNEESREFFTNFAKFFGVEHCPVYSVIGSVTSQEFIKVIAKDKMPAFNWFVYDSQTGYGRLESSQAKANIQYTDLPELTRKIENQDRSDN